MLPVLPTGSGSAHVQPHATHDGHVPLRRRPVSTSGRHIVVLHDAAGAGAARVRTNPASLLDRRPGNRRQGSRRPGNGQRGAHGRNVVAEPEGTSADRHTRGDRRLLPAAGKTHVEGFPKYRTACTTRN